MTDTDLNIKLCYLNDKINKLNASLDQKITDSRSVIDSNTLLVDSQQSDITALKNNQSYSKSEIDLIFATKAEAQGSIIENQVTLDDVYTKTQADSTFVPTSALQNYYTKDNVYTKTEMDTNFVSDASLYYDKATLDTNFDLHSADLLIKKNMVPETSGLVDIGSATKRFGNMYLLETATINIGDATIKNDTTNGGILVSDLVIGDDTNGKYKLSVNVDQSTNEKSLQIIDVDGVQETIDLKALNDLISQNQTDIQNLQAQIDNL